MTRLLLLPLLFLLLLADYPCGEWLSVLSQGSGYVIVQMDHHIVGCPEPVRTTRLDGQVITPFWLSGGPMMQGAFVVRASPGPHTISVEDYCPPPCGCTSCSSLDVVLE